MADKKPRKLVPMAHVWARLRWNLVRLANPLRWLDVNPYVLRGEGDLRPKSRTPWEDITHSLENVVVEGARHVRAWWQRKRAGKAGIPD